MNRTLAALAGLFAITVLVQANEGGVPAGALAPESLEARVDASLTPTASNPATVLTLVNTVNTSSWSPPSPDPTGLTYRTNTGRILVSDSEVDEIVPLFTGMNLFETTAAGVLFDTGSLTARTLEPDDIAWDSNAGILFVADDNLDRIFRINPQADGKFGTADDTSETTYTTSSFGSDDAEGLAYNPADRSLWVSDGVLVRVYHLERGADGQFNTADDVITSWDARPLGMRQPEGIEFDSTTGHLFLVDRNNHLVAEATTTGTLVALFDLSGSPIIGGAAITLAPASGGSGTNIYVADRGVDNDVDPNENDGKIFEFARTTVSTDVAPIVANPGGQFNVEGDAVSLQIVAFEPNGDPMTFSAINLPDGLSIDPGTGLISGTVALGAAAASHYSVQVSASDGGSADAESFLWTVNCDDGNACTADAYDPASGGCVHTAVADGTACSDTNACTQTDTCQTGACTGSNPVVCVALDQCHDVGMCDPATGVCSNPAAPDGTACNDGDACTQSDTCQAGACNGSNPVVCSALDQCHDVGTCDPATGVCSNPAKPDGTACTDGNACTTADTCNAGVCGGGAPLNCDDANPCTDDACDPLVGCVYQPIPVSEPDPLLFGSQTTMSWPATPDATHWNTYRGAIPSALLGSRPPGALYDHVCLESGDAFGDGATMTTDSSDPPVGTAHYYLDSGEGTCGESDLGHASSGAVIPNALACPTPP